MKKAVKRTLNNKVNVKKKKNKRVQELKGTSTALSIKKYFYKEMPTDGWIVFSVTVDKRNAQDHLTTKRGKKRLYNYLANQIITKLCRYLGHVNTISLTVDRSKDGADREDFNNYVRTHIEAEMPMETNVYIDHELSHKNAGLQAVDLFCYGCQRRMANGSDEWFDAFKSKVKDFKWF